MRPPKPGSSILLFSPYSLCYFFSYPHDVRPYEICQKRLAFFDKQITRTNKCHEPLETLQSQTLSCSFFHAANLRSHIIITCKNGIYSASTRAFFNFLCCFSFRAANSFYCRVLTKLLNHFNYLTQQKKVNCSEY